MFYKVSIYIFYIMLHHCVPTIFQICYLLASEMNLNNFGFNWKIYLTITMVYLQILKRSYYIKKKHK